MVALQWNERGKYEENMLGTFVGKPEKTPFYLDLYERATRSGAPKLCWKWSWWAFFGGALFLIYRKAYLAALIVFGLSTIMSLVAQALMPAEYLAALENAAIGKDELEWVMRFYAVYLGATICAQIFIGGYAPYFIIKRYCELKEAIENKYANNDERASAMALHGGVHKWAIWLAVALCVTINLILIGALIAIAYPK
jgi:lipid-A-disaccharide synthase-like uncharacterized protein